MNFITHISSYLYPVSVEKRKGTYLPVLEVNVRNGKYLLDGEKVNYSFGSLHELFRDAFKHHQIGQLSPQHVLILGFGAGSVAQILQNELHLNCKITGVEIDPVVLELATRYFGADAYQNTQLICDDAYHFISQDTETYDLIVIDLFIEKRVPKAFLQADFIQLVKQRLNPLGTIFFNRINDNPFQQEETKVLIDAMNEGLNGQLDIFNSHQNDTSNSVLVYRAAQLKGSHALLQDELHCIA